MRPACTSGWRRPGRGGRRSVAGGRRRFERRVGARCGLAAAGRAATRWRSRWRRMAASGGADAAVTAHYPHRDAAGVAAAGYRASAGRAATPSGAGLDFLSVSFGYTEPLWRFWQSCGFELVRIGSKAGGQQRLLYRDGYLAPERARRGAAARGAQASGARLAPLRQRIELALAIPATTATRRWAKRIGASWPGSLSPIGRWRPAGALQRLLLASNLPLRPAARPSATAAIPGGLRELAGVSGQKALLRHWRHEAAQALNS